MRYTNITNPNPRESDDFNKTVVYLMNVISDVKKKNAFLNFVQPFDNGNNYKMQISKKKNINEKNKISLPQLWL